MIVVVAHRDDQVAHTLIARWAADGARLLTCSDLSVPGYTYYQDATDQPINEAIAELLAA